MSHQTLGGVMISDASDHMGFAFSVDDENFSFKETFTPEECEQSSGFRELLTIIWTIESNKKNFKSLSGQTNIYYWLTDSMNTYYWFKSGSRVKPFKICFWVFSSF